MVFSTDGGTNWTNDPELDTLMTANGVFRYQNQRGPRRTAAAPGRTSRATPSRACSPTTPENGNFLVAGGVDSGIFLSVDGGTNWSLVTTRTRPASRICPARGTRTSTTSRSPRSASTSSPRDAASGG